MKGEKEQINYLKYFLIITQIIFFIGVLTILLDGGLEKDFRTTGRTLLTIFGLVIYGIATTIMIKFIKNISSEKKQKRKLQGIFVLLLSIYTFLFFEFFSLVSVIQEGIGPYSDLGGFIGMIYWVSGWVSYLLVSMYYLGLKK